VLGLLIALEMHQYITPDVNEVSNLSKHTLSSLQQRV
jgi:hypothetical protein